MLKTTITLTALVLVFVATPTQASTDIIDGDLIKTADSPDVYSVKHINNKHFKRLILNPTIFDSYGHLSWDNIKEVSQTTFNTYHTSTLIREVYPNGELVNGKVYKLFPSGDTGIKRYINLTQQQFVMEYDSDSIYNINHLEAGPGFYRLGQPITHQTSTQRSTTTQRPQSTLNSPQITTTSTSTTSFTSATSTQRSTTNNKFALSNILAQNKRGCSTDLLGLEGIVGEMSVVDMLCIKYTTSINSSFYGIFVKQATGIHTLGFYVAGTIEVFTDKAENKQSLRRTLIHELCHANQDYYRTQKTTKKEWYKTPAGQEFISITGYSIVNNAWFLSPNSPYRKMYNKNPQEFAAEVCTIFLHPTITNERYNQTQINAVLNNQQLKNWYNQYVVGTSTLAQARTTTSTQQAGNVLTGTLSDGTLYKLLIGENGKWQKAEMYYQNGTKKFTVWFHTDGTREQAQWYRTDGTVKEVDYYRTDETLESVELYRRNGTLQQLQIHRTDGTIKLRCYFYCSVCTMYL